MDENPENKTGKRGRPLGRVTFASQDAKKQRVFARYLNRHVFKTLEELEQLLAGPRLVTLECMAIRTLLRAATKGEASTVDLILNTDPTVKLRKKTEEPKTPEPAPVLPELPSNEDFDDEPPE